MPGVPELFDSGVPRSASAELAGYFSQAAAELRRIVLHPPGGTQAGREFRQARAAEQLTQIDKIHADLRKRFAQWLSDGKTRQGRIIPSPLTRIVHEARSRADRQAIEAGVRGEGLGVSGGFSQVDVRTAAVFARDLYGDLDKAAAGMVDRGKRLLRSTAQEGLSERDINRILAVGSIEGKPVETIKRLRDELQKIHGDTVPVTTKNGEVMNFDAKYYAEMVVRTKTREATETARHERLEELGLDLVAVVGRISNNFCTAFLGQVFSLSGKHPRYPSIAELPDGGPPFHPHCTKSTRPFVEELASAKQMRSADILPDSRTLLRLSPSAAQKAYTDLQIRQQVAARYATTARKLFG